MNNMTAKEFFSNTFSLDFLSEEEQETIFAAAELYAKGKIREAGLYTQEEVIKMVGDGLSNGANFFHSSECYPQFQIFKQTYLTSLTKK